MRFIESEFPAMRPRIERPYSKKQAQEAYRKAVQSMVRVLQERYGLRKRKDADADAEEASEPAPEDSEQIGFAF